jgi:hypothetical protein
MSGLVPHLTEPVRHRCPRPSFVERFNAMSHRRQATRATDAADTARSSEHC